MPWVLRSLRWWIGHILVIGLCVSFVNLGFWQLQRAGERRFENQVVATRFGAEPLPVQDLIIGAGDDLDSLEFRQATARGLYQPEHEVLVRSQTHEGVAGFHVVTPLLLPEGTAVMVNRGWVPLDFDTVPNPAGAPVGEVEVEGWLRPSQEALSTTPNDDPAIVSTVDLELLQTRLPWELAPLYLVAGGEEDTLPTAVPSPDLFDEGPHLLYAWQWFAFTVIVAVGYILLLRRALKSQGSVRPS